MDAGVLTGSAAHSGSRSRMLTNVSEIVSPSNPPRPVSISYSTHPNAQMSVRLSTECLLTPGSTSLDQAS